MFQYLFNYIRLFNGTKDLCPKSFSNHLQPFSIVYQWLYRIKKNNPPDSDIWKFKCIWNSQAETIIASFKSGTDAKNTISKIIKKGGRISYPFYPLSGFVINFNACIFI